MKRLDAQGREILDPTPVAIPAGFKEPMSMEERIQRLIRTHLSRVAEDQGMETFEESEDFDVEDEIDPSSRFETFFDPILGRDLSVDEFQRNAAVYRQKHLERELARGKQEDELEAQRAAIEAAKTRRRRKKAPEAEVPEEAQNRSEEVSKPGK